MFTNFGKKLKGKYLYSLLSIFGLLIAVPALEAQNIIVVILLSFVMLLTLYISTTRKGIFRTGIFVAFFCIVDTAFFELIFPSPVLGIISWIIFLLFTFVILMKNLFSFREVSHHDIFGGLVGYLIIALTWVFIFSIIEHFQPDSFHFPPDDLTVIRKFVYFSFVTMTTLGYGDIYPVREYAQVACIFLTVTGQFYALTIISLIVGKYIGNAVQNKRA